LPGFDGWFWTFVRETNLSLLVSSFQLGRIARVALNVTIALALLLALAGRLR
jgi:hypothetical protein